MKFKYLMTTHGGLCICLSVYVNNHRDCSGRFSSNPSVALETIQGKNIKFWGKGYIGNKRGTTWMKGFINCNDWPKNLLTCIESSKSPFN